MVTGKQPKGFAYLWLLGILLVMSLLMGKAVDVSSTQAERQREEEVLAVGDTYRRAITHYIEMPGSNGQYPQRLEDLVQDPRFPNPVRHLRKLYPDPETGQPWEPIVAPGGGIMGVRSTSARKPWKQQGFPARYKEFGDATTIAEWQFTYQAANKPKS
ncbi:type II secretion system protein [Parachitinimonas caeni]|uniref:Type II secretion system protein n=1 Tax=Parachitinimonas caeni TaxID=3031301 RepID=A0ABT7E2A3_9NEIS|nr:type II secretion system protein [Parachitinimonas caeni]MDK2126440.1 type II secretion system protein [Parachitinimonas caeni]